MRILYFFIENSYTGLLKSVQYYNITNKGATYFLILFQQ